MKVNKGFFLLFVLFFAFFSCSKKELNEESRKKFTEAKFNFLKKDFDGSIKLLNLILNDNPEFTEGIILKMKAFYYKKDLQNASFQLNKAKELSPQNQELLLWEARLILESQNTKGSREKAIGLLNKVVSEDPYHFRAQYELGKAYKENGQYKEALLAYRTALTIEPYLVNIRMDIADIYKNLDYKDKTKEILEELKKPMIELSGTPAQKEKLNLFLKKE